jgi:selenide,water dikinase
LPRQFDKNLLIGYDSSDDAAVYKLTDDIALVQTLDFFTPVVEDPYLFGKIAAVNALSDIYAMGGDVKLALNIVAFPENMDSYILQEILRGGSEKVIEAGGVLCGGHSIDDVSPKYGLSVTGVVHPEKILANNNCKVGDRIILTKPLGVGIILTGYKMEAASREAYDKATKQMETLNKYAAEIMKKYDVHAATDVTGFGFLGHLHEMTGKGITITVNSDDVPYIDEAFTLAKEFYITGSAQKNRNYLGDTILLNDMDFAMTEILFDPQTSGGLLISVSESDAEALLKELNENLDIKSAIVGEVVPYSDYDIIVI